MRKLVMTIAAVIAVATLATGTAEAVNMKGKWGPGVSFEETPLDVKFGLSPKSAVFFGLGFSDTDIEGSDTDFGLGAGFEYALFGNDDFNLNFQPSIQYFTGGPSGDLIRIPVALSAEVWMNDRISVGMSHGIAINMFSDDDDTEFDEGQTTIGTFGASVTAFRFRFYVK
ncbi:MAG TPA: hypothetical protein VF720_13935 [Candidatus Eisenbacteria bacterium]